MHNNHYSIKFNLKISSLFIFHKFNNCFQSISYIITTNICCYIIIFIIYIIHTIFLFSKFYI